MYRKDSVTIFNYIFYKLFIIKRNILSRIPDFHCLETIKNGVMLSSKLTLLIAVVFCMVGPPSATASLVDSNQQTQSLGISIEIPKVRWNIVTVQKRDSLSKIFSRVNLSPKLAYKLVHRDLRVIHPGDEFRFAKDAKGNLLGIEYRTRSKRKLIIIYSDKQFEIVNKETAQRVGNLAALLNELFSSGKQEMSGEVAVELPKLEEENLVWRSVKIRRGDNLVGIFKNMGLSTNQAMEVANASEGKWLVRGLQPNRELRIATYKDGTFASLEFDDLHRGSVRKVILHENQYFSGSAQMPFEVQEHYACAKVNSNLYASAAEIDLPVNVVDVYTEIFASRIDFSRQLRKGDEFCLVYNQKYRKGNRIGKPLITAASLKQANSYIKTVPFRNEFGNISYYDQNGFNLHGSFLKSPLKHARVTSIFSNNRFHPVLKKWRAHKGVDYGARRGTPIMATANGVVKKRQSFSGYGKTIILDHEGGISTLYAHMSKYGKGTARGSYVQQGQVIGYVGSTGISTAPHLHYEFRVAGKHVDPLVYPMQKGSPLPEEYREKFFAQFAQWSEKLEQIDEPKLVYVPKEATQ